jgi:hypothetical protein
MTYRIMLSAPRHFFAKAVIVTRVFATVCEKHSCRLTTVYKLPIFRLAFAGFVAVTVLVLLDGWRTIASASVMPLSNGRLCTQHGRDRDRSNHAYYVKEYTPHDPIPLNIESGLYDCFRNFEKMATVANRSRTHADERHGEEPVVIALEHWQPSEAILHRHMT